MILNSVSGIVGEDHYDYSEVEYVNNSTHVMIICRDHGAFPQISKTHLDKSGCPDCAGNKRLTSETFIEKAKAVHGNLYDYSKVEYVGNKTKVTIICPDHGPFPQSPIGHIFQEQGCPDCAATKPLTTETFIEKAEVVHGDRYDYSSVNYANAFTYVTIVCPDHGPFPQTPTSHLAKHGCPDCAGTKPLTTETFIEKAKVVHGDRYDYSEVEYVNQSTKVMIICREHGAFEQRPADHINQKSGCPDCADSGFNPNDRATLYYLAIATDDGDTRYKIGITNRAVEERFRAPDLGRIRIVKTWRYGIGRTAAEREAEILAQYAGDKYYGPDILQSGNTELFTHDILGLDTNDEQRD